MLKGKKRAKYVFILVLLCAITVVASMIIRAKTYNYDALYNKYIGYRINFPNIETATEEAVFAWSLIESATELVPDGYVSPGIKVYDPAFLEVYVPDGSTDLRALTSEYPEEFLSLSYSTLANMHIINTYYKDGRFELTIHFPNKSTISIYSNEIITSKGGKPKYYYRDG